MEAETDCRASLGSRPSCLENLSILGTRLKFE
jgi:hypothetical protein